MVNIGTTKTEDRRAEREREYGTYVAAEEIRIDGVLAFGIGHPVPVSHTEEFPQLLKKDTGADRAPVVTVEEYEAMREAEVKEAEAAEVAEAPLPEDGRSKWVKYAAAQGAPADELATLRDGGLTRDELAEKYGPQATE